MSKFHILIFFLISSLSISPSAAQVTTGGDSVATIIQATTGGDSVARLPDSAAVVTDTTLAAVQDTLPVVAASSDTASASTTKTSRQAILDTIGESRPDIAWSISFGKIFWAILIITGWFFVIRNVSKLLDALAERWTNVRLTIKGVIPVVRVVSWTIVLFGILVVIIEPPVETLIAFLASAGIALGFASQDVIKNIFGGIIILLDRPFQVGDKIEAAGYYGEVSQIGLRSVRIVTPDDNLVSIPNGELMNTPVSNANAGESNCQVVAEFYLPSHIDLGRTKQIAYRAAAVSRYIYLNKPIAVVLKNEIHQGRSILKMRLKAYVLDIRYEFAFMTEMTEIVIQELYKAGIVSRDDMIITKKADD